MHTTQGAVSVERPRPAGTPRALKGLARAWATLATTKTTAAAMKKTKPAAAKTAMAAMRKTVAVATAAALALCACLALCAGCASVVVDDSSPRLAGVQFSSTGTMTEASQSIVVRLAFDRPLSASGDVARDFTVLLNGAALDEDSVSLETLASAEAITFTLRPSSEAAQAGGGAGARFALYESRIEVASARSDGALPSITGASGSCAVLSSPVEGTLPSGLAIEVVSSRLGSAAEGEAAQTVIRITSPALVRAITWFSPDGGTTKLLKHNHNFATSDESACAADLADIVNAAAGLGLTATARGDTVTLTATEVQDGQRIEPIIMEGVGVEGGAYDPSQGTGEGA